MGKTSLLVLAEKCETTKAAFGCAVKMINELSQHELSVFVSTCSSSTLCFMTIWHCKTNRATHHAKQRVPEMRLLVSCSNTKLFSRHHQVTTASAGGLPHLRREREGGRTLRSSSKRALWSAWYNEWWEFEQSGGQFIYLLLDLVKGALTEPDRKTKIK